MARLSIGCDVAGPGEDETVGYARDIDSGNIVSWRAWIKRDPRGDFLAWLHWLEHQEHEITVVNIDAVGIGYYFALHVRDHGYTVVEVNVAEHCDDDKDKKLFANKKAQFFWVLRTLFENGEIGNLTDDLTIAQLTAIEYRPNNKGQVEIESKDELKTRGVGSPDRAEGLMLSVVPPRKARKRKPLPVTVSVSHARF